MRKFMFLFVFVCISFIRVSAWIILDDDGYCENGYDRKQGFCKNFKNCTTFKRALLKYKQMSSDIEEKLKKYTCGVTSSGDIKVCCPESEIDFGDKRDQSILPEKICGSSVGTRITGGSQTNIFELPWMAALFYDTEKGLDNLCGGTIITNRYILTAAHCIVSLPGRRKLVGVQLGVDNLEWKKECNKNFKNCMGNGKRMNILETHVHPEYNKRTLHNDIALIRLSSEIDFSLANMKPICLPSKQNNPTNTMLVSGWGVNSEGYESLSLLKGEVPIVNNKKCSYFYKAMLTITENQICAGGYNGTDSCRGDSGGPLMYKGSVGTNDDRYIQMGIVSFGPFLCGKQDKPGVYTKIEPYMSWILEIIKS